MHLTIHTASIQHHGYNTYILTFKSGQSATEETKNFHHGGLRRGDTLESSDVQSRPAECELHKGRFLFTFGKTSCANSKNKKI